MDDLATREGRGRRDDRRDGDLDRSFPFMAAKPSPRTDNHFAGINDPRRADNTYPLNKMVTIALSAAIA